MKSLIVVESPTKVKTIKKIVGRKYDVVATVGHIIDLPKSKLGLDEETLEPQYVTIKGKGPVLKDILSKAASKDSVIIATDPDREGEAIAWHVRSKLEGKNIPVRRARFNEITETGILQALEDLTDIDMNMVYSQQARRILDRLVGYKISPLLWRILYKGLSAGRVQSAALRLVVERELEIRSFLKETYWDVFCEFDGVKAKLTKLEGKKADIKEKKAMESLLEQLRQDDFIIVKAQEKESPRRPLPPFRTSTLQQEAYNRLGYSAKKTMMLAQRLYEGISLPTGNAGLITYMRTDSLRVSSEALTKVRDFVQKRFGEEYCPAKPNFYGKAKGNKIQDAHEAIRPADINIDPEKIKEHLERDLYRLYKLIWDRFVASQMSPARYINALLHLESGPALFEATGSKRIFEGFEKVYAFGKREEAFLDISRYHPGDTIRPQKIYSEEKETSPPPYYTDATLVKKLESMGIGRPSTYASILSLLTSRNYVEREEKKLKATDLGMIITDYLKKLFPKIVDYDFTRHMEKDLDLIENGEVEQKKVLIDFHGELSIWLKKAEEELPALKKETVEETSLICDKCGKPMVIKWGRNGRFLACSGYPDCKNTMNYSIKNGEIIPEKGEEAIGEACPQCGGELVVKQGRFGKFIACSRYPECRYTRKIENKTGVHCPKCHEGDVVVKRTKKGRLFYGCSRYPECDFVSWYKPVGEKCPQCDKGFLIEKGKKILCSEKDCSYERQK
ncbi:MAG TPA: type I DNA topoisomerase [Firmicutes bacterium]|nr:type I DNA topoisomerase [Bacillota bacterium]